MGDGITVLSLFDGISCGRVALERTGIKVKKYYASEIDKHALIVSKDNWKDIIHIGDVTKVSFHEGVLHTEVGNFEVGEIDLVLAGSPCQGFSMAGKQLAFDDPRSKLFFCFEEILKQIQNENPGVKYLLENVKMKKEHQQVISDLLGVEPIAINSNLVSAQNRYRLYWTNIKGVSQPGNKGVFLPSILEAEVDEKYHIKAGRLSWLQKFGEVKEKEGYVAFNPLNAKCLTARGEPSWNTTYIIQWPHGTNKGGYRAENGKVPTITTSSWESTSYLLYNGLVRKLSPIECERLQTLPDNYTKAVSDGNRYKALGNGWTVDVIAHILSYMG